MTEDRAPSLQLFYCYAREDEILRDRLDTHLAALKHAGSITSWYDGEITPGTEWEEAVTTHLQQADIILLLVSPDFIASKYCYGEEMRQALARHQAGEAQVVPILLHPVHWPTSCPRVAQRANPK
jgi:internalin A